MMKKRLLPLLFALVLLFSGCAPQLKAPEVTAPETTSAGETAETTETKEPIPPGDTSGFCAGAGRADITPESPVPLAGYGNVDFRISNKILDPLYVTCVAVRDEDGETLLLFNLDIINTKKDIADQMKELVSKDTGVPVENMLTNCTHTHSAPALTSDDPAIIKWQAKLYKGMRDAAKDALADLDACTIFVGTTETDRLNFVRRYYKENGFICDNADYGTGEIIAHETEIDQEMRIVRFVRENRKDVVLVNWQCHPHRTGGSKKYDVSSDIIGVMQQEAEKDGDMIVAYLQGGAGNVDPFTRIPSESRHTYYKEIGAALAEHLREGLENLREIPAGKIRVTQATITAPLYHADEEKLPQCQEIANLYYANDRAGAMNLCAKYGIVHYFEATAIITRSKRGESGNIPLACYAIGDIGISAVPFEEFCQTARDVRASSPFAFTLTCGYSNDSQGYLPAYECWANKGYEIYVTHYAQGTAELVRDKQIELLNALYAE